VYLNFKIDLLIYLRFVTFFVSYISYIKYLTYILLFLISFNGLAQEFADKAYYLVDSLVLDAIGDNDKQIITSSLKLYHAAKDDTSKINALNDICENMMHEDWEKYQRFQLKLTQKALKNTKTTKESLFLKKTLAGVLNNIGYIHDDKGNIPLALAYYQKSLKIKKEIGDKKGMAYSYNNIGAIHRDQGNIPLALAYYQKSLKIKKEVEDKKGMASSYYNLGYIHQGQGNNSIALGYYQKSLKIQKEIGDKHGMGYSFINIGFIHQIQDNMPLGLTYYQKSLKIQKEIGDKNGISYSYLKIGAIHKIQGNMLLAIDYYQKSLKIQKELGDKRGMAYSYSTIGYIHENHGNIPLALEYGLKSLTLAQEVGLPEEIRNAAILLSEIYEKQGKGKKALEMYKLHIQMKDSINNEATQKASIRQQAKYEFEKVQAVKDKEHEKQLEVEQEAKAKQKVITYAAAGGLGLVGIFLFFVMNRLKVTRKQKAVIEEQKEVVEEAHQEIQDSIAYAKRIQSAILPPIKLVKEYLKESFILYKPKDVVAGDFYWMESVAPTSKNKDNKILFAAADCTGHGVPGAMVSVVCNNALNRSVREHGLSAPGEILTKTREIVIAEFEKSEEEVKDGMDIAMCSLEGMKLQYAGAHNPLWIIRNGEIIETKANKQPIGQFDNPEPYTTHSFELESGDSLYIFSDGYVDQFGGEKGKKFKAKAFRELLLSIQDKDMEEQKTIIDEAFETWRGSLEQIDDVCVIGVRV